jgi:hypothetical protein
MYLDKDMTMDNVQQHTISTNVPSSQTFRTYSSRIQCAHVTITSDDTGGSFAYSGTPKMETACSSDNRQHGVIYQKTELFITTVVRTSNPKSYVFKTHLKDYLPN